MAMAGSDSCLGSEIMSTTGAILLGTPENAYRKPSKYGVFLSDRGGAYFCQLGGGACGNLAAGTPETVHSTIPCRNISTAL